MAASRDSQSVGPIQPATSPPPPLEPITSLSIAKTSGTYVIGGKKKSGGPVSWHGTSRANALAQMEAFLARLV